MKNRHLRLVIVCIILCAVAFVVCFNSLLSSAFSRPNFDKPPHEFTIDRHVKESMRKENWAKKKFQ